jgi:hypothetical protein
VVNSWEGCVHGPAKSTQGANRRDCYRGFAFHFESADEGRNDDIRSQGKAAQCVARTCARYGTRIVEVLDQRHNSIHASYRH